MLAAARLRFVAGDEMGHAAKGGCGSSVKKGVRTRARKFSVPFRGTETNNHQTHLSRAVRKILDTIC